MTIVFLDRLLRARGLLVRAAVKVVSANSQGSAAGGDRAILSRIAPMAAQFFYGSSGDRVGGFEGS
jgi:hypothetical protein